MPNNAEALRGLIEYVRTLGVEALRRLDEDLLNTLWTIADELDTIPIVAADELPFVGKPIPEELASNLDWGRALGPEMGAEFGLIDLRWRLDAIEAAVQAVADIDV